MIAAKIMGKRAWCGQGDCTHAYSLAKMASAADGSLHAGLTGHRWRPDGFTDGMERYVTVKRTGRTIVTRPDGQMERRRNRSIRPQCPIVVECPGCKTVQTIGLTPTRPPC